MISSAVWVRSGSASDLPISTPSARKKVLAMPPPMISLSTLAARLRQHADLLETLAPPMTAAVGRWGLSSTLLQRVDLLHQQRSGIGRQQAARSIGGGMRAMRRRKSIVDENVAERGQTLGERGIVLFLARVKAQILQHCDAAGRQRRDRSLGRLADTIGGKSDRLAQSSPSLPATGVRLKRGSRPSSGRPKCEMTMHAGAALCAGPAAPAQAFEPRRVADLTILDRHIEIGAHQHALDP